MNEKKSFLRKLTTIILILLITNPVFGFGKEAPDQVLTKYLKSLYSNNLKKTYSYLSKADKNTISRIEFIKQNSLGDPFTQEIAKTVSSLRKYKVNETIINEDNATVRYYRNLPGHVQSHGRNIRTFSRPKKHEKPTGSSQVYAEAVPEKG